MCATGSDTIGSAMSMSCGCYSAHNGSPLVDVADEVAAARYVDVAEFMGLIGHDYGHGHSPHR